jgi:hypothetical protein
MIRASSTSAPASLRLSARSYIGEPGLVGWPDELASVTVTNISTTPSSAPTSGGRCHT